MIAAASFIVREDRAPPAELTFVVNTMLLLSYESISP